MRFQNVETFVGGWFAPQATRDLFAFCEDNGELKETMSRIVPENMHGRVGLVERCLDCQHRRRGQPPRPGGSGSVLRLHRDGSPSLKKKVSKKDLGRPNASIGA